MIGIFAVAPRHRDRSGVSAINRGFLASVVISLVLAAVAVFVYLPSSYAELDGVGGTAITSHGGDPRVFALVAVAIGIVPAALIQQLTGADRLPHGDQPAPGAGHRHVLADRPGHRRARRISLGLESAVYTALLVGLAINVVSQSAGAVVHEVRRQFREHPGIMDYEEKPEYGRVVDICTKDALREPVTPVCWRYWHHRGRIRLRPRRARLVSRRCDRHRHTHGGLPRQFRRCLGQEAGLSLRRQGSDAHAATVIGDPFKDTAVLAINPLLASAVVGRGVRLQAAGERRRRPRQRGRARCGVQAARQVIGGQ